MDDRSSYDSRRNLQFVSANPRFLQKLETERALQDKVRHQRREDEYKLFRDEQPMLVDAEGHPLPDDVLESDKRLDSSFSVDDLENENEGRDEDEFNSDLKEIEKELQSQDDIIVENSTKRSRRLGLDKPSGSTKTTKAAYLLSFDSNNL